VHVALSRPSAGLPQHHHVDEHGIAMLAARAKTVREGLAIARHNFLQPVKSLHIMIA